MPPKRKHDNQCGPARIKWWWLNGKEAIVISRIKLLSVRTIDKTWETATRSIVEVVRSELGTT